MQLQVSLTSLIGLLKSYFNTISTCATTLTASAAVTTASTPDNVNDVSDVTFRQSCFDVAEVDRKHKWIFCGSLFKYA